MDDRWTRHTVEALKRVRSKLAGWQAQVSTARETQEYVDRGQQLRFLHGVQLMLSERKALTCATHLIAHRAGRPVTTPLTPRTHTYPPRHQPAACKQSSSVDRPAPPYNHQRGAAVIAAAPLRSILSSCGAVIPDSGEILLDGKNQNLCIHFWKRIKS